MKVTEEARLTLNLIKANIGNVALQMKNLELRKQGFEQQWNYVIQDSTKEAAEKLKKPAGEFEPQINLETGEIVFEPIGQPEKKKK